MVWLSKTPSEAPPGEDVIIHYGTHQDCPGPLDDQGHLDLEKEWRKASWIKYKEWRKRSISFLLPCSSQAVTLVRAPDNPFR